MTMSMKEIVAKFAELEARIAAIEAPKPKAVNPYDLNAVAAKTTAKK